MKPRKQHATGFLGSVAWLSVSKVVTQLGTWSATIIIARILTPEDYGLVGMVTLLTGLLTMAGDFGINASIIQKQDISERELSSLFWFFVAFGLFISLILFLSAPFGCYFWGEPRLLKLIRISSVTFFFTSLAQIPDALLQKQMRFKEYGIVLTLSAFAGSLVSVILAFGGAGASALVYGVVAIHFTKMTLCFCFHPFFPRHGFHFSAVREHLVFGGQLTAQRYLWWYYSNCDFWLASKLLTKGAYGSYSLAFQLASLPLDKIASVVTPVALGAYSKLECSDLREKLFLQNVKYLACVMFPVFIGLFWVADDLILLVLGNKWVDAVFVFKCFVLIFPLRSLAILNGPLLVSIKRTDVLLKVTVTGAIAATISFAVGVNFGIVGLALSWLCFYPLFYLYSLLVISKKAPFSLQLYWKQISPVVASVLGMSLAIIACKSFFFGNLLVTDSLLWERVISISSTVTVGVISFIVFTYCLDRPLIHQMVYLTKKKIGRPGTG